MEGHKRGGGHNLHLFFRKYFKNNGAQRRQIWGARTKSKNTLGVRILTSQIKRSGDCQVKASCALRDRVQT